MIKKRLTYDFSPRKFFYLDSVHQIQKPLLLVSDVIHGPIKSRRVAPAS